jgi:hypothetical protein
MNQQFQGNQVEQCPCCGSKVLTERGKFEICDVGDGKMILANQLTLICQEGRIS